MSALDGIGSVGGVRSALAGRRCLVLADGFYEWPRQGTDRRPFYVTRRDGGPFAFAGLWDRWQPPGGGDPVESCTIITTQANDLIAPFHERMPVIIDPADFDRWLDRATRDPADLKPLLRSYPAAGMSARRVSQAVNAPANDTSECIAPAD